MLEETNGSREKDMPKASAMASIADSRQGEDVFNSCTPGPGPARPGVRLVEVRNRGVGSSRLTLTLGRSRY